jgi:HPt (histidine-containing phosphotransfer) domain-containing protein
MLERGVISELREVMGPEFGQLVQTFLDTSPDLVDQLRQAERDGDVEAMVLPAHSLKSGSANMGAMYLSSLARETEMAARRGDLEAARKAAAKVPEVFIATCTALRSELG